MKKLGYSSDTPVKIIRLKHRISLDTSCTALDVYRSLSKVPDNAVFDEMLTEEDGGITTLVFHEERKEQ